MEALFELRPEIRFLSSVCKDGPKTYYEFFNRPEKHVGLNVATSDGKAEPYDSIRTKNIKIDKRHMPKRRNDRKEIE